jgi:hypothetical protein
LRDWVNKLDWNWLSFNPNAIELLKKNQDKINWHHFSKNPNIFTYDYKLMSVIFHPENMNKWKDWGFMEHLEIVEFINE